MREATRRRPQITMMMLAGLSLKEIAQRLKLSPRTVDSHRARIYERYGCQNRIELLWAVAARQEEDEVLLQPKGA